MRGTTNRTEPYNARRDLFSQERVLTVQQNSDFFIYFKNISSSECDASFQELSSRQSCKWNQILTVTDMASLRGRSYEICITSEVEAYIQWPSTRIYL